MAELRRPKAVLFDLYNTLIDIRTEEQGPEVWGGMASFLSYLGVDREPDELGQLFRQRVQEQQANSAEAYPEIDVPGIFEDLAGSRPTAVILAQLFRALGMRRLQLFPDTLPTLQALQGNVKVGLVSDAQRIWLVPEMRRLGLDRFFSVQVVSSDYGYRKPDGRLFRKALEELQVAPEDAVFVGDSAYRDVGGAQGVGVTGCLVTRHAPFEKADLQVHPDIVVQSLVELIEWVQSGKTPVRL